MAGFTSFHLTQRMFSNTVHLRQGRHFFVLLACLITFQLEAQIFSPLKSRLPQGASTSVYRQGKLSSPKLSRSKVSNVLWGLYQEHQQVPGQKAWTIYAQEKGYDQALILSDEKVVIEAVAEQDAQALKTNLEAIGLENGAAFGRMVSGLLPISQVAKLSGLKNLRTVRAGYRPYMRTGSITSQGDAAQGSDLARNACGLNGEGLTVGIISDTYNFLGGEAEGIASGDLPGPGNPLGFTQPVNVLDPGVPLAGDEGRAMAEIIHDVAPGAALAYHTGVLGQANFALGVLELAEAGADVIVDDIGYFDDPFFQDGIIAQAVDIVSEAGVSYVSSAGNDARASYESEFRPTQDTFKITEGDGFPLGDYILHDFDPGPGVDVFQRIIIPTGGAISFQWSQAFASICPTSPGADSDLDIFIFTEEGDFSSVIFGGVDGNIGADPLEFISFETDFFVEAYIVIGKFTGIPEFGIELGFTPNPDRIKCLFVGADLQEEFATNSSTIIGHPNANGAIAVGAVFYEDTPDFGQPDPIIEPFSSAGGTPILLTPCGDPIDPEVRQKPEVSGPDGGNNTFFGGDAEGDGFPNFFGTSASSPHVAGLVALMKQADSNLSPSQIKTILQNTALDMDDPFTVGFDEGFDFGTGFGLVQGLEALSELTNCGGIARLELYNADTDELVQILNNGNEIPLASIGTDNLAIRAIPTSSSVGSVEFEISGAFTAQRIENIAPYTSFGNGQNPDGSTDFFGQQFPFGVLEPATITVEATAFSEPAGQGEASAPLTISFNLVDEPLLSFSLIDASTDQELGVITDFTIINTSLVGENLNIRVNSNNEQAIGSVGFTLEETDITVTPIGLVLEATENIPPFALFGDNGANDFKDGSFAEAFYLLTATPFSEDNLQGVEGPSISLIFAVSNDGGLPDGNVALSRESLSFLPYPNPLPAQATNLQVKWEKTNQKPIPITLSLLNQWGETLYQQKTELSSEQGLYQLDVQGLELPRGLYFLRVEKPGKAPEMIRVMKD